MQQEQTDILIRLFEDWSGEKVQKINMLTGSGSNRHYYRLYSSVTSVIGVIGEDDRENRAFLEFSSHFKKHGLHVPEIYTSDPTEKMYILQDLGDVTLFDLVSKNNGANKHKEIENYYKQSIDELIKFQIVAGKDLDYGYCYPREKFDELSMQWDLNYFKYYSLKFHHIQFDEEKLEKDFHVIINYLLQADAHYFMYRDFQTRNILIHNHKLYFIDYQGGRKGPLQYDLASLMFQAKAELPFDFRMKMLDYYIERLEEYLKVDRKKFIQLYYGFVLLRTLQVLGAYGFRGNYERKPHFIESLGFAVKNVDWLLDIIDFEIDFPELKRALTQLSANIKTKQNKKTSTALTVEINSFSYLYSGIPEDESGHGGGFVFDCRFLPNPGRFMEFKQLTGLDQPVIDFLKREPAVDRFFQHVSWMVGQAIDNYIDRDFDHLIINFGCTGGQHRSVYLAQRLYEYLTRKYEINLLLNHRML